VADIELIWSRI